MRHMMLRNTETFGDLMQEILAPYKYGPRIYQNDVGSKDEPAIISRGEWVEKKYKAWREEDGSFHEELIDEDLPTRPEITD